MTAAPQRLQLSRRKGFDLQAISLALNGRAAVVVARPGRWGNPLRVGMWRGYTAADAVRDYRKWLLGDLAVASFSNAFGPPPTLLHIQQQLRGRNLACWCAPGRPCHADVLLDLANR